MNAMPPPPPVPFFTGRSVSAGEVDGLLAIRPLRGHRFDLPPGTQVLYLPTATLVRVSVRRLADPAWSLLEFHGTFRRTGHASPLVLEALASEDAEALLRCLHARYKLPRIAGWRAPFELEDARAAEYVRVVATYKPGHLEEADFEGLKLTSERPQLAALVPGRRYQVTGIFSPGVPADSKKPRPVGYSGPRLHVMAIAEADAPVITAQAPPAATQGPRLQVAARSSRGLVRDHHQEAVAVFQLGSEATQVVGPGYAREPIAGIYPRGPGVAMVVLDGVGGQSTGDIACEIALAGFAVCFAEAPPPGRAARSAWLAELVARVSLHLQESSRAQGAAAVAVAMLVEDELHVSHLGDARVYCLREGRLSAMTEDHSLHNELRASGAAEEQIEQVPAGVLTRMLGFGDHDKASATSHELREGDVVLLASCGLHTELGALEIAGLLGERTTVDEICGTLEARAEQAGGNDNISVLVARVAG